jgi:hypothetical protein
MGQQILNRMVDSEADLFTLKLLNEMGAAKGAHTSASTAQGSHEPNILLFTK